MRRPLVSHFATAPFWISLYSIWGQFYILFLSVHILGTDGYNISMKGRYTYSISYIYWVTKYFTNVLRRTVNYVCNAKKDSCMVTSMPCMRAHDTPPPPHSVRYQGGGGGEVWGGDWQERRPHILPINLHGGWRGILHDKSARAGYTKYGDVHW
jgi:hypothetical protein